MKKLILGTTCLFVNLYARPQPRRVVTLFAHGIVDSHRQAQRYAQHFIGQNGLHATNDRYTIETSFVTFDFADSKWSLYNCALGQYNDIKQLRRQHALVSNNPHVGSVDEIILYGVSRGASTTINFMALHQPNNIAALVLEAPFAHMDDVIELKVKQLKLGWIPHIHAAAHYMVGSIFRNYVATGEQPINNIKRLPADLPILLVCTAADDLVPYTSTVKLYDELKKNGHTKVHLLVLKSGKHAKCLWGTDGEEYQNAVHAFYRHYGLPHNADFAQKSSFMNHPAA